MSKVQHDLWSDDEFNIVLCAKINTDAYFTKQSKDYPVQHWDSCETKPHVEPDKYCPDCGRRRLNTTYQTIVVMEQAPAIIKDRMKLGRSLTWIDQKAVMHLDQTIFFRSTSEELYVVIKLIDVGIEVEWYVEGSLDVSVTSDSRIDMKLLAEKTLALEDFLKTHGLEHEAIEIRAM